MAQDSARMKDYSTGANIVVNKERGSRRRNEPTGEAMSLKGRDLSDMGSKANRGAESAPNEPKAAPSKKAVRQPPSQKSMGLMNTKEGTDILNQDISEDPIYTPKTRETKMIYDQILHIIRDKLGDRPGDEIDDIANEIIATLKMDDLRSDQRKELIKPIFDVSEALFTRLVNLARELKDYTIAMKGKDEEDEEEFSMVIKISDLEGYGDDVANFIQPFSSEQGPNQEGDQYDEVADPQAEKEANELQDAQEAEEAHGEGMSQEEDAQDASEGRGYVKMGGLGATSLQPSMEPERQQPVIDMFWLSTELNKIYKDPVKASQVEMEVLQILTLENIIECENRLLSLLQVENFELTRTICDNRKTIYYLTALGKASQEDQKSEILKQVKEDPEVSDLFKNLEQGVYSSQKTSSSTITQTNTQNLDSNGNSEKSSKNVLNIDFASSENLQALANQAKKEAEKFSSFDNIDNIDLAKRSKRRLNLAELMFERGSHQMSNTSCKLPKDSTRQRFKGYEEVYIPQATSSSKKKVRLVPLAELPEWIQPVFKSKEFKHLNAIQSKVYQSAFKSPKNMLVCAPTGAGKTNIALLSILNQIGNHRDSKGAINLKKFKIVYIAPMKALVSEIVGSFKRRLDSLGIQVREMTGDMQLSRREIEDTQVIVATPEKWDIVTRKAGEKLYLDYVKLLIIDEIHLLHDSRGPVLESIIARTLRHTDLTKMQVRIVGLSATFPNSKDAAELIRAEHAFYFDSSYRPIPLEQRYIGLTVSKGFKRMMLTKEILFQLVMERVGKNQVLVFVHSRKDTFRTAKELKDQAFAQDELDRFVRSADNRALLKEKAKHVQSHELKELLPFGIGIHHAGLPRSDRSLVEDLYSDRRLEVLVSTATLAWGVNLPARTVIIKGTQVYNPEKGSWVELSPQDILQMLGRAGRPNLDTQGEGIILTSFEQLRFYLSLLNTQLPIESQFVAQLPDQLNAEITLGSVTNLKQAVEWLGYTYLYTRMKKSPATYSITPEDTEADPLYIKRRADMIHSAAVLLNKHNLIRYDRRAGTFVPTTLGRIASHYYIKHPSIAIYSEHIRPGMDIIDLFKVFSLSSEFRYVPVRDSEKIELEKLLSTVPIPVRGGADDPRTKINVLLQAHISRMRLDGYALKSDMVFVTQSASRIMRGLFEVFMKRGWANVAEICLRVCKMIDRRQWTSMTPLRQIANLDEKLFRRIENQSSLTWEHFLNMTPQQVGNVIRDEGKGSTVHKLIHQFPRLTLNAYVQPITRSCIKIELLIETNFNWVTRLLGRVEPFWIMVTDVDDEVLLYYELVVLKFDRYREGTSFIFTVPLLEPLHPQYFVKVVSDRWLHCETQIPISFKNLLLPAKFPPCTELLELQPVPFDHFKAKKLADFLRGKRIRTLNPIQTQVSDTLYSSFESVFLGAPGNSGKSVAALIALGRLFEEDAAGVSKALFLAPNEDVLSKNQQTLKVFCEYFGKKMVRLQGAIPADADLRRIAGADLVISTAEHWDYVSRRWKAAKKGAPIRAISLVILEHVHMINHGSSAYEVCCARLRLMFATLNTPHRIIALATSVANSRDLADWLGVSIDNTFNFHPRDRPIPLDLQIHTFDQHEATSRFYSMTRQLYQSLTTSCKGDQVIIFVDSKKSARLAASHLSSSAAANPSLSNFVNRKENDDTLLQAAIAEIQDVYLKSFLEMGIGYVHEGMPPHYVELINSLFSMGVIRVMIITHRKVWVTELKADTVAILDTKYYSGALDRMMDYPVEELIEFLGRAGRLSRSRASKSLLFCHSPLKEHLLKFLLDPLPVESHLHLSMTKHINAEIASKTIKSKEECMDWIAWTFFYRRLQKNPNFYDLLGISDAQKNEHLSEMIETTVKELSDADCIICEDESALMPINGGKISTYYYIDIGTVNWFLSKVSNKSDYRVLMEIVSSANEFESVDVRKGEENILKTLHYEAFYKIKKPNYLKASTKVYLLLQAHMRRRNLSHDLYHDKSQIILKSLKLLRALVDCICYHGWLVQTLQAMKMSQMLVQGLWHDDSPLYQLPYFNQELVARCKKEGISEIASQDEAKMGLLDLEEDEIKKLLNLGPKQLSKIAQTCNRYPDISFDVAPPDSLKVDIEQDQGTLDLSVSLAREGYEEDEEVGPVISMRYPEQLPTENWWIVAGDEKRNKVLGVKLLQLKLELSTTLRLTFAEPGDYTVLVYLICDSYIGCDQQVEKAFKVKVTQQTSGGAA